MDALILTCGTGGGHNAAARAIREELTGRGIHSILMNPYALHSEALTKRINRSYVSMAQRTPAAFGAVYAAGECYRKLPVRSPVYHANGKMAEAMEHYLSGRRFDVIIMTHLFPAEILTYMKRHGIFVPKTIFVATDYTCIPFTEETECDAYVIPSEQLIEEFVNRGIPQEKIYPYGIPVKEAFSSGMEQDEAKERLGLAKERKYILVSGGSIGAGQLGRTLELLIKKLSDREDLGLIAICGNNERLFRKLNKKYVDQIRLMRQTDEMAAYLSASSLFLSKPGGLSSTEAAVMGRVLLHLPPIPGCETKNAAFFEENGMSRRLKLSEKEIDGMLELLEEPEVTEEMIRNQREHISGEAAARICDLADTLLSQ